jgi:hypothetical protein
MADGELAEIAPERRWMEAIIADVDAEEELDPALRSATVALAAVMADAAVGGVAKISAEQIVRRAGLPDVISSQMLAVLARIEDHGWLRELPENAYRKPRTFRLRIPEGKKPPS